MCRIIEFMDMKSTKFGGLDKFMVLLMRKMPNDEFHFVYQSKPQSADMIYMYESLGAKIHVIDTEGKKAIKNIPLVLNLFKNVRPNVVHFHFANSFFIYAPIAKIFGAKCLIKTQHCCLTKDDLTQIENKKELNIKTKLVSLNGYTYKIFDKIIMCGKYVQRQFEAVYGPSEKYETVYFGVAPIEKLSTEKQQQLKKSINVTNNSVVIVTTAFADPVKGVDVLINSLPFIKGYDFVLIIVGLNESLPLTQEYHRLAKRLGVEDKIRWIGITDKVGDFLSIADIYCQPSRSEALPLAVCEAMSAHLPILGSKVGGLPEVANVCFTNEDYVDLSDKMSKLIMDSTLRQKLAQDSYEKYKQYFDINVGVEKYSQIYNCI